MSDQCHEGPAERASHGPLETVEAAPGGVVLRVRARPGARRNAITGLREGELCVAVTDPPDRGRANDAIARLLAKRLGLARGKVELLSGPTNRHKRFSVEGVTVETAVAALNEALETGS